MTGHIERMEGGPVLPKTQRLHPPRDGQRTYLPTLTPPLWDRYECTTCGVRFYDENGPEHLARIRDAVNEHLDMNHTVWFTRAGEEHQERVEWVLTEGPCPTCGTSDRRLCDCTVGHCPICLQNTPDGHFPSPMAKAIAHGDWMP